MMSADSMRGTSELLSGWGNYPRERCRTHSIDSWRDVENVVQSSNTPNVIPRGLGRSYGDSTLTQDGVVLRMGHLNRFLAFDSETGILECEAGVSFAEIIETFLPQGWFLPTTPGTKFVTLGGAIAADVHGKNHHIDGSFGNFVNRLTLLLADGSIIDCTRDNDPDLFWATIGGMGLTGVILSAQIRLSRVETAYCDVTYRRTQNLESTLEMFTATHQSYRYSVSWIDCLATGTSLGRGVVMLGNDAPAAALPPKLAAAPLALPRRRAKTIPFDFPSLALNSWSIKAFNTLYYAKNRDRREFVDFNSFFYPLDGINHWNRIYGKRGFVQYQALFPTETAHVGLHQLLERIARSRQASFLAVIKGSGPATPGMLSYLFPGITLALDFPNRGKATRDLFEKLDEIVLEHSGRLYLAKDALTSAGTFARMYPRLAEFQRVKERVDPHNRFVSSQARRLGIVTGLEQLPSETVGHSLSAVTQ